MKQLAIIGAGKSSIPFIHAAKRWGYRTIVFDRNPEAPGVFWADEYVCEDLNRYYFIRWYMNDFDTAKEKAHYLTYSSNFGALRTWGILTERYDEVMDTINKIGLNDTLKHNNILTSNLINFDCEKMVAKPIAGSGGGAGIRVLDSQEVYMEEYIDGKEYSIDGYVQNGNVYVLGYFEKYVWRNKYGIKPVGFKAIEGFCHQELTEQVITAIGITNSFFSIDIIDTGTEVYVIDVGLLMDMKIDRYLMFCGVDVYDIGIALATGVELRENRRAPSGSGMKLFYEDGKLHHYHVYNGQDLIEEGE